MTRKNVTRRISKIILKKETLTTLSPSALTVVAGGDMSEYTTGTRVICFTGRC